VEKRDLEVKIGTEISRQFFNKITGICKTAIMKYSSQSAVLGLNIAQSFRNWKKGSKKFRSAICRDDESYVPKHLIKFATNVETIINFKCAEKIGRMWSFKFLSNEFRTFLFKLYNNLLPYNTVLSHIVRGKSRNCTFCDLQLRPEITDETAFHLFYYCDHTAYIIRTFFTAITDDEVHTISQHELFCCFNRFGDHRDFLLTLAGKFLLHYVWECKLRNCLVSPDKIVAFFRKEFNLIAGISKDMKQLLQKMPRGWNF
jgi:hypothetical protein